MTPKPMWTWPRRRRRFVMRNQAHAGSRYRLDRYFAGRDPLARRLCSAARD